MACSDTSAAAPKPVFADKDTINRLLGVPEGTLRQLARDLVVAAHKLGSGRQDKCVYLFADVEAWVNAQPAPKWVQDYQANKERKVPA